jgi:hypothetical protein
MTYIREDPKRTNEIFRAAFFRGYIVYQEASTRQTTCLKKYHYVEIGWIGQKRIKTREQTYMELMVEMMEEFIKELT